MNKEKKYIFIYSSIVAPIKNVVLNKAEREEVEKTMKLIKKIKLSKKHYFDGFKENTDESSDSKK